MLIKISDCYYINPDEVSEIYIQDRVVLIYFKGGKCCNLKITSDANDVNKRIDELIKMINKKRAK